MTKLLEKAFETARALPSEMQDEIARMMLSLTGNDDSIVPLSSAEEESLSTSLQQADRREFATDEQVEAVWSKHGL